MSGPTQEFKTQQFEAQWYYHRPVTSTPSVAAGGGSTAKPEEDSVAPEEVATLSSAYDAAARQAYQESVGKDGPFDERAYQEFKTQLFEAQWYYHTTMTTPASGTTTLSEDEDVATSANQDEAAATTTSSPSTTAAAPTKNWYAERNARLVAAAAAGKCRWGELEVLRAQYLTRDDDEAAARALREVIAAADHGLRNDGGVGGLTLAERVALGADAPAAAAMTTMSSVAESADTNKADNNVGYPVQEEEVAAPAIMDDAAAAVNALDQPTMETASEPLPVASEAAAEEALEDPSVLMMSMEAASTAAPSRLGGSTEAKAAAEEEETKLTATTATMESTTVQILPQPAASSPRATTRPVAFIAPDLPLVR